MPRQKEQLIYNSFSGGLITEASPLTFPDGASIDESNFELTKQGYRKRRLGIDTISDYQSIEQSSPNPKDVVTFLWEDSGNTGETYLVVSIRNEVLIYNITSATPGDNLVYKTILDYKGSSTVDFTAHSGSLIAASGAQTITVIRALGNDLFTERKDKLKVRDRVGVADYVKNEDLEVENVDLRNAEKAGLRPTAEDLYLDGAAGTENISFDSKRTIVEDDEQEDGSFLTKTELGTVSSYPVFMGYPIETILIEKIVSDSTNYSFSLVFKDRFFKSSIESDLISGMLNQTGGIIYSSSITEAEYDAFLALTKSISLTEFITDVHPHIYNLWNQGWGESRLGSTGSELIRPIDEFVTQTDKYPSMADSVNYVLYADTAQTSNRTADRFHPADLEANPPGSLESPKGRYVIDALNRGTSRRDQFVEDLIEKEEDIATSSNVLINNESTSVGAQTVAEYAGRVWYAGFSEDSPGSTLPLSNKVLYSQVGDDKLQNCYQEADPTSSEESDLVDTDGGWVNIDAIDKVIKLVTVDTALLVFASNGVWAISGIDGNVFTPTGSHVSKITSKGSVNSHSVVVVDSDIIFWAKDGAYRIVATGYAEFGLEPLTKGSINNLVVSLSEDDLNSLVGAYDERLERVVWLIDKTSAEGQRRELIYHLLFGAFTINTYNNFTADDGSYSTNLLSLTKLPLFESEPVDNNIVAGGFNIIAGTRNVISEATDNLGKKSRLAYIGLRNTTGIGSEIFFADTIREDFKDWGEIDAEAYLVSGYVSGGDTARMKGASSITTHFNRTESNATEEGVENESSCLLQSQWEWTNDAFSNKWSNPFQAYRLPKPQIRGIGEPVAEGIEVVTTKNKLRGRGRVFSLRFSTEAEKDCQILGWSIIVEVNNNV
jgi:hypothetical protein